MTPSSITVTPRISHEEIASVLTPEGKPVYLPTEEQRRIIEAPLDPALVVAGAGSGKTQTMMLRILWLIANEGIAPQQILGLTFTRKAAGELRERIEAGLHGLREAGLLEFSEFDMPEVATYNSYASAIYTQYALLVGRDPDAILLDEPAAFSLMREVVLDHEDDTLKRREKASVPTLVENVLVTAREMREMRLTAAEVHDYVDAAVAQIESLPGKMTKDLQAPIDRLTQLKLYADIAERYELRKRELGFVEFSDQVSTAAEILELDPSIASELRDRSRVVILDEYQDTSVGQIRLLASLFRGHSVMAVGDPKQSIYGWRGASAANMRRFHEDFDGARLGQDFELSISWRNDERVLEVANLVAAPLPETRGAKVLGPRPGAGEGSVESAFLLSDTDEADRIADWFHRLLVEDSAGAEKTAATLVRNRSQMATIAKALAARGVPHQVLGLGGLLSTPEVVDLNAILRAAGDDRAGSELIRVLVGAQFEVGLADIAVLSRIAKFRARRDADGRPLSDERARQEQHDAKTDDRGESLADALETLRAAKPDAFRDWGLSATGEARLREAAALLHDVRTRLTLPLGDLVSYVIHRARLDIETVANPNRVVGAANLNAYLEAVVAYTAVNPRAGIAEFLDWATLVEADDNYAEVTEIMARTGVVQLTTMHSAKGLEWDYVAVPQLCENVMPSYSGAKVWIAAKGLPFELRADRADLPQFDWRHAESLDDLKQEFKDGGTRVLPPPVGERASFIAQHREHLGNESRRLAYVAVTRARSRLLLTGCRWRGQGKTAYYPSEYFHDMVGDLELDCPAGAEPYGRIGDAPVALHASLTKEERKDINEQLGGNPNASPARQQWPRSPLPESRLVVLTEAGDQIRALLDNEVPGQSEYDELIDLLLAEREASALPPSLALPERFGASLLHDLLADPESIARQQRRTMPQEPFRATLIGNLFHGWVESLYTDVGGGGATLEGTDIDDQDRTDPGLAAPSERDRELLARYQQTFLASRFARGGRRPEAVELAINNPLGRYTIIGKLDAVYADEATGEIEIVDWKTGRAPSTANEREGRELQLMAYAHAYSASYGVPLERIRATLYYVASDQEITVRTMLSEDDLLARLEAAEQRVANA